MRHRSQRERNSQSQLNVRRRTKALYCPRLSSIGESGPTRVPLPSLVEGSGTKGMNRTFAAIRKEVCYADFADLRRTSAKEFSLALCRRLYLDLAVM